MKRGARLLEVITLFMEYDYSLPSDIYLHHALKTKRYIGGSDRRFVRESFYHILRQHLFLEEMIKHVPVNVSDRHTYTRAIMIAYSTLFQKDWLNDFNGERYHPAPLTGEEQNIVSFFQKNPLPTPITFEEKAAHLNLTPFWYKKLQHSLGVNLAEPMEAMNKTAPLDLRIHALRLSQHEALSLLRQKNINAVPLPFSPFGIRVVDKDLFDNTLITEGWMEPQDEGSQIITIACDVAPKMRVVDFCAGAGGKTLGLSMMMKNQGSLFAMDVEPQRLKRAQERFRRLGLHNISTKLIELTWIKRQKQSFDRVLVDAPCSGSGTWRRNPDLKRRVQEKELENLIKTQREIIRQASTLVKPGGRLIYATCSLLKDENDDQIAWFLGTEEGQHFRMVELNTQWDDIIKKACAHNSIHDSTHPTPCATPTFQLTPLDHNTDGFFVAVLEAE